MRVYNITIQKQACTTYRVDIMMQALIDLLLPIRLIQME